MKISNFQASINQKGVLQNNRFQVQFALPNYLRQAGEVGLLLTSETQELITLRCEAATFPGMSVTTMEQPRIGYGPLEFMPHNVTLEDISLTFLVDAFGDIHRLFYEWHNTIVNVQGSRGQSRLDTSTMFASGNSPNRNGRLTDMSAPYEVGYKVDYSTDISVSVYDKEDDSSPIMVAKMYKAFPKNFPALPLSWASTDELVRLVIPFTYTDFHIEYNKVGLGFEAGTKIAGQLPNFEKVYNAKPATNDYANATTPTEVAAVATRTINDPTASAAERNGARAIRRDVLNLGPKI